MLESQLRKENTPKVEIVQVEAKEESNDDVSETNLANIIEREVVEVEAENKAINNNSSNNNSRYKRRRLDRQAMLPPTRPSSRTPLRSTSTTPLRSSSLTPSDSTSQIYSSTKQVERTKKKRRDRGLHTIQKE